MADDGMSINDLRQRQARALGVQFHPDYNKSLSELHQRVVQAQLQVRATIDDMGWVGFEDPDLGELTINLREDNPEFMRITCMIFKDYKDHNDRGASEDIIGVCNRVNTQLNCSMDLARLSVRTSSGIVVYASVALLLAASRGDALPKGYFEMPDEAFLRAVIVRAMSSLKAAAKEFADELQKAPIVY